MNTSHGREGVFLVKADGGSMWPFIRRGDTLVCREGVTPAAGDLALYRREGILVCHRVAGVEHGKMAVFLLRGDFSGGEERVPSTEIKGVVLEVLRGTRRFSPGGRKARLLLALLPAARPGLRGAAALYMAGKKASARLLRKKGYNG